MYGGGFATVPAYLRDMFGTRYVGAIHGLLITAWSMAGIFGPGAGELHPPVPHRPRRAEGAGLQRHHVHHGGLLIIGFICNALIKAVNAATT